MSVLELFSRFELSMHSKARFLVHVASPNPHSCERLKVNFHRSHLVRQFSAFRNFQETCFVIYCLIINVLLLFSCDSLVRISQAQYCCQPLFKSFFIFFNNTFCECSIRITQSFFTCQYFFTFFINNSLYSHTSKTSSYNLATSSNNYECPRVNLLYLTS